MVTDGAIIVRRMRQRIRRQRGGVTVRLSFFVSDEARRVLTERIWRTPVSAIQNGMASEETIREWAWMLILDALEDEVRIDECVELGCSDTDDDHDHADGPKV